MNNLINSILSGNRSALARAITLVENRDSFELLKAIEPYAGKTHSVGITGPPGAGKSTFINAITKEFLKKDSKIGIIAIDPSSPFTGGAVLGDRIRMKSHTLNDSVFMRSMSARGCLGGLSAKTNQVVKLMDAFGMDKVIIETVGVGQSEVDIAKTAATVIVLLAPGFGDEIQALKAGILEIADIFIVNKSDNPLSLKLLRELERTVMMNSETSWQIPVIRCNSETGDGLDKACELIELHLDYLKNTEEGQKRSEIKLQSELISLIEEKLRIEVMRKIDKIGGLNVLIQSQENIFDVSERVVAELLKGI